MTSPKASLFEPGYLRWLRPLGSRLTTIFFVKVSLCFDEKAGYTSYRDLGLCDRNLGNRP